MISTSLLAQANRVKLAVEAEENRKFIRLTQDELDRIPLYQFTVPTAPKPGFMYKREHWKIPGDRVIWGGPHEGAVRHVISQPAYQGPLASVWYIYTCEQDPKDKMYVVHRPKEVKVIS